VNPFTGKSILRQRGAGRDALNREPASAAYDFEQRVRRAGRWEGMAPSLPDLAELDDDTERFAVQTCPCCAARTAVPLGLPFSACEVCGERIAVAPLPRVTAS
jgi:hypothetical protein